MANTHILKKMVLTEKGLRRAGVHEDVEGSEQVVVFRVDTKASKPQIKTLIESLYSVKVKSINTLNQLGKMKIFKQRKGYRSDFKKAYVTLVKGHKIELDIFKDMQGKEGASNA